MPDNLSKVQQAFRILHPLLAGYVAQELSHEYKDSWWQEVLMTLSDQSRDMPYLFVKSSVALNLS